MGAAQSERDHVLAKIVHGAMKTSQLQQTPSDIMHFSFNAGGASSLGVLSYLTAVSMENFYSPRDLARYVLSEEISLPGVLVPQRGSRSKKKAVAALQAYRKKNGVKNHPKRHEKIFERDTFLWQN